MAFDPVTAVFGIGEKLIDRFFPDPQKKSDALLELQKLQQSGDLARMAQETQLMLGQIDINKIEAASPNWLIAGARPAAMWVCDLGLFYEFVFRPIAGWLAALAGHPIAPPSLDMGSLMTLLSAMLGLTVARTAEKLQGAAGNH